VLTRASEKRQQVWLLYADNAGASSVRLISSINLMSGAVQAFDVERATVRRFAVSRIAGVRIVSEQED
jgi:predicted DNA-binding transcriptional regulator YafY